MKQIARASSGKHQIIIVMLFLLFFVFIMLQHSIIFLYHDDYGYASLSYAYWEQGVNGQQFSFSQLINYLKQHYLIWGGRVLYFFLEIVMLRVGIWLFRIVQSFVLLGIYYLSFKIGSYKKIKKDNDSVLLALTSLLAYGLIPSGAFRTGIYWFTSSVLYVFPMLMLLLTVWFQEKSISNWQILSTNRKIFWGGVISLGYFLASFSQEQISVMVVTYSIVYLFMQRKKWKKYKAVFIAPVISSIMGLVILFIAPGNQIRMERDPDFYGQILPKRIISNIPNFLHMYVKPQSRLFVLLACTIFALAAFFVYQRYKKKIILIYIGLTVSFCGLQFFFIDRLGVSQEGSIESIYLIFVILAYVCISIIIVTVALIEANNSILLPLFIGAIVSQAASLNAPYFQERMMLPLLFVLSAILVAMINSILNLAEMDWQRNSIRIILLVLLTISVLHLNRIYNGYKINEPVHIKNDLTLKTASHEIAAGKQVLEVNLLKLPAGMLNYAGDQAYLPRNSYIEFYMKEYYDLPQSIAFNWD